MTLKLFELVGTDEARPFSPFCWRTRMALAHKGLSAQSIPWCFTEKDAIAPHKSEKVPVLLDGESSVADSWAIANYLEDRYPDRPSLFGGEGVRRTICFSRSSPPASDLKYPIS
jgi:glutathione S-transferase